jgi:rod shape-determining protein MreB
MSVRTFLKDFAERFTNDMAIDLGTSSTLIYVKGKGILLNEPSVLAIDRKNGTVTVGGEAKKMMGRTPKEIEVIRPMKDGVIVDFSMVEIMLKSLIGKVQRKRRFIRPRVIVGVPSGITEVEKRAVEDSVASSGAREVYLVSEPIAAAVGVGLPVETPTGNMIVDIGGGTTEIAVIALSGVASLNSIRIAGDEMDDAIILYLRRRHNLVIGEPTAEEIKIRIGSAFNVNEDETMAVKGLDLVNGIPKTVRLGGSDVREALQEPVAMIIDGIKLALEKTPPELVADIVDRGIFMSGGGSLLQGLDLRIKEETGLPVKVADNALECVALGAGKILEDIKGNEKLILKSTKR